MPSGVVKFVPNDAGIQAWLIDNLYDDIEALAWEMADDISAEFDVDCDVQMTITDRPHATVMILDSRGKLLQARDGALTKAAARVGLEVRGA